MTTTRKAERHEPDHLRQVCLVAPGLRLAVDRSGCRVIVTAHPADLHDQARDLEAWVGANGPNAARREGGEVRGAGSSFLSPDPNRGG